MTEKITPDSDGNRYTKRLRSQAIQALKTARVGILLAAVLVAYPNGHPARASIPEPELQQVASLPLDAGGSRGHITLPNVTVVSPTYSEPSTNGDGPRVIGPCSRGGDGRIVCPNLIPPLHYNR